MTILVYTKTAVISSINQMYIIIIKAASFALCFTALLYIVLHTYTRKVCLRRGGSSTAVALVLSSFK